MNKMKFKECQIVDGKIVGAKNICKNGHITSAPNNCFKCKMIREILNDQN